MSDVKIPYEIFLALVRVHVGEVGTAADKQQIRAFLSQKVDSLANRQRYTLRLKEEKDT